MNATEPSARWVRGYSKTYLKTLRMPTIETLYEDLLRKYFFIGAPKDDRTGIGTGSVCGRQYG